MKSVKSVEALLEKLNIQETNFGACSGPDGWIEDRGGRELVSYNPTNGQALARIIQARDPVTAHHAPTSSYIRRTRQGRTLEILSRALPDGGSVRTYTDVTDYVQTQEALARQKAMLGALVDNIPDRIWLKDVDGVYLLSNPAHQRQHGLHQPLSAEVGQLPQRRLPSQVFRFVGVAARAAQRAFLGDFDGKKRFPAAQDPAPGG